MAIISGGDFESISISPTNSIENRLAKLLLYLKGARTRNIGNNFSTPMAASSGFHAVAGQSQGGGHAALIAVKYHVAASSAAGRPRTTVMRCIDPRRGMRKTPLRPRAAFLPSTISRTTWRMHPRRTNGQLAGARTRPLWRARRCGYRKGPYHHARILTTNYPWQH